MPDKNITDTHFDYFHSHKWVKSIRDQKNLAQYHIYWQRMVEKMKLACEIVFSGIEDKAHCREPENSEIEKYNGLFKEDVNSLLEGQRLNDEMKACIDARIAENFQILRNVLAMRNIANRYDLRHLHAILEKVKGHFANRLYEQIKSKKTKVSGMLADHNIERKIRGGKLVTIFYNCPIFGVFKHMGLEELSKEFCILCEAHGKKMAQFRLPFQIEFYLAKSFSRNNDCCIFIARPRSPILRFLMKVINTQS
jgi:hypothetical protein